MKDHKEFNKSLEISVSDSLKIEEPDDVIVATVYPSAGEPRTLVYEPTTASGLIAQDSTAVIDLKLEADYLKIVTEEVERSKGWGEGIKFSIGIPKLNFKIEFEKKHRKETKTIREAIFRRPQKK